MLKFDTLELVISTNYGMIIGTSKNELLKDYNICLCGCVCVCFHKTMKMQDNIMLFWAKKKQTIKDILRDFCFIKEAGLKRRSLDIKRETLYQKGIVIVIEET